MDFRVCSSPLEPRPRELPWACVREMLCEILVNLSNPSVYDFLLHTSPLFDVNFLSSPQCTAKGISSTASSRFWEEVDGRGVCSDMISVTALLPTHITDKYMFALGVSSMDPSEGAMHLLTSTELCSHYVLDLKAESMIGFSLDESEQFALVDCIFPTPTHKYSMALHFDLQSFMQSFRHQTIDHDKLTIALRKSYVMELHKDIRFPKMLPNYTGSVLIGEQFPDVRFKHLFNDNLFARMICSEYEQGTLKVSKLSSCWHSQNIGTHHGIFDTMRHWAIRFKLASIKPVPKFPLTSSQITRDQHSSKNPGSRPEVSKSAARKAVSIAPAQILNPSANHLTHAQIIDAMVEDKKMRRRIKNRISAAKCNERRRARRQPSRV